MAVTPVIPDYITVHLGAPTANARNVRVPYTDYIKNVASSEIYPTWPENSLRANIYAINSFALNRVFNEHYRSRGYDFDVTNLPAYDQAYTEGREIFGNVSQIVDEIFNDYVTKGSQIQPYFTAYCDGKTNTCSGLSQWGTVSLANQGQTPLQILKKYYGNDINIVQNAPVKRILESYPGIPLRIGSVSEEVHILQNQLNRIGENYPSIPRIKNANGYYDSQTEAAVRQFQSIFNLTVDGIVGKATWYKIKRTYNAVKKVSDLYSEGITLSEVEPIFPTILKRGDRGLPVRLVQFYLSFIGLVDEDLEEIDIDGIFGPATEQAVKEFQKKYGLAVDGIVGRQTWNKIQNVYISILKALPEELQPRAAQIYPGYVLTVGARGTPVTQVQKWLNIIAKKDPAIPSVTVDGIFGDKTRQAIMAFQKHIGIPQTGYVGPVTWWELYQHSIE